MHTTTDASLHAPDYHSTTIEYSAVSIFESTYSSTVTQESDEYEREYVDDTSHTTSPPSISILQPSNIKKYETLLIIVSCALLGIFICCCLLLLIACAKWKNAATPGSTSKVAFQVKTGPIDKANKNQVTYNHNQTSPDLLEQKSISSLIKNYLFSQSFEVHENPNPSTNPEGTPELDPTNVYPPRPKLSLQPVNSNSSTVRFNMHNTGSSIEVDFINTGKLERYQSESITASNEHDRKMEDQNRSNKPEHVELEMAKVASNGTVIEQMRNTGLSIVIDDEEEQIDHVLTPKYCDDTPLQQIPDPQYSVKQSSPDHEGTPSPLYKQSSEAFEDSESQSGEFGERSNEIRALKGGNNDSYGQEYSEY